MSTKRPVHKGLFRPAQSSHTQFHHERDYPVLELVCAQFLILAASVVFTAEPLSLLAIAGGEPCHRCGGMTRTRMSVAQPQCGQTGS